MDPDDGEPRGQILTDAYAYPGVGSVARYTVPIFESRLRWGYLIVTEDFGNGTITMRMDNDVRRLG